MVDKVFPGQPIKASTINDVIDLGQSNQVTGSPRNPFLRVSSQIWISNPFTHTVFAGEPIPVGGMKAHNLYAEQAKKAYQTSGYVFYGTSGDAKHYAVAAEAIQPGALGRASLPGLVAAMVYQDNNQTSWPSCAKVSDSGYFVSSASGPWDIVGSSQEEPGGSEQEGRPGAVQKWCFLIKKPDVPLCQIYNSTNTNLVKGQILEVSASVAENSFEFAQEAYDEVGAHLVGVTPTGSPYRYCAILLDDCAAGEYAPCHIPGVIGAVVQMESHLDLTVVTEPAFLPVASAPMDGRFVIVSSRNNWFDRRNRFNSFDYGLGGVRMWRILSYSAKNENNQIFAYLIPAEDKPFPARIIGAIPIAANRWLYTIEELTIGTDTSTGLPYFDYRAGGKGWENRIGWAYNACEPTARIYPTRTREKVTASVPYWSAEDNLWLNDAAPIEITHTVRRAEGVVMVYGNSFQGFYFVQPNLPIIENVILTTDKHDVTTASPELSSGDCIDFADGGQASDSDARAQGSGKKCEISWSGGYIGRSDWSLLSSGVKEIVFAANNSQVTVSNGRATIIPMLTVNGNRCEKIVFQGNGVAVGYNASTKTATITID